MINIEVFFFNSTLPFCVRVTIQLNPYCTCLKFTYLYLKKYNQYERKY